MSLIWQDYATEDRASRLWIAQHPLTVKAVQLGAAAVVSCVAWVGLVLVGKFLWVVTHFTLGPK